MTRPAAQAGAAGLPAARAWTRRDRTQLGLVFVVALAWRLASWFVNRAGNPLFEQPMMDGLFHDIWAREIAGGDLVGHDVFFRAPLYPYLLALVYSVSAGSIAVALLLQHVLGAGTAALVYVVARTSFSSGTALLAGLLAACYWPLIYFEGDLLIVTLIVFLDLLALYFLARGLADGRLRWFVLGGAALGLSAIARPNVLIFLMPLPVLLLALQGRRAPWLRNGVAAWAAAGLFIAPVLLRNWVIGHDVVPIASQGGVNFYIGNNPDSDGVTAIVPGTRGDWIGGYEDALRMAEQARGRPLKPSEVSSYYFGRGAAFFVEAPGQALAHLATKLRYFWGGAERPNNKDIYFFWQEFGLGRWPLPLVGFWLVGPLALLGLLWTWRGPPELRLYRWFCLVYMLGVVAFFVNARFRLPVVPVLIVFAAHGAVELVRAVREARWGRLLLAVPAFLVVDLELVTYTKRDPGKDALSWASAGNAYDGLGRTADAIRAYETALELNREVRTRPFVEIADRVLFNLGRAYWKAGERGRALALMERGDGDDPRRASDKSYLAACYLEAERPDDALRTYGELARLPGQRDYLVRQARGWHAKGLFRRAELALRALVATPVGARDHGLWVALADALEAQGRSDEALDAMQQATIHSPQGAPSVPETGERR